MHLKEFFFITGSKPILYDNKVLDPLNFKALPIILEELFSPYIAAVSIKFIPLSKHL